MIELPEAAVLADQINRTLPGKRIARAVANQTPHKFAWYTGDPARYGELLAGKTLGQACAWGANVEIKVDDRNLLITTPLRYHAQGEKLPGKHQLLIEFDDGTALSATVQMWGCLMCFKEGEDAGFKEYPIARQRPSPLTEGFDWTWFKGLMDKRAMAFPAKAFLATEQRIPGLGNGVLQDILWKAGVHPRTRMDSLSMPEVRKIYQAVRSVLKDMARKGGRDTERDLFGCPGGYQTILSKNTVGKPCPVCGKRIKKEAFLGGSIYYCPGCQAR